MKADCLIIGGGPAGLVAATYLGRFRRSVLLMDSGASRASWIPVSHNVLGFSKGVSGGPQAKAALQKIAMGQTAQCKAGHRSYDRIVAQCFIKGESIGDTMRKAGIQEGGRAVNLSSLFAASSATL